MRAISLIDKIEFNFPGNVARNAVILGDVDNDGRNELIVGNSKGVVSVYKYRERVQTIMNLSFVSCLTVGDALNSGKNYLVIITADGWCYVYEHTTSYKTAEETSKKSTNSESTESGNEDEDSNIFRPEPPSITIETPSGTPVVNPSSEIPASEQTTIKQSEKKTKLYLNCIHVQRIPANAKIITLADVDNDGQIEMVLGLTDRVVRSYRWTRDTPKTSTMTSGGGSASSCSNISDKHLGKFLALNKWECTNQIGAITLHHNTDGTPTMLIAQPGGTFMRIRSTINVQDQNIDDLNASCVDYQSFGINRMRNPNISTEILGNFKGLKDGIDPNGSLPYAIVTLDGCIMFVQDEKILWSINIDQQIFALTKLDVTGDGADEMVVCSWDGHTYILDQKKNSVEFQLNQSVQAFHSGLYHLSPDCNEASTCLIYVTFKNTMLLYYNIPLHEMTIKQYQPKDEILAQLFINEKVPTMAEAIEIIRSMDEVKKRRLIQHILYNVKLPDS